MEKLVNEAKKLIEDKDPVLARAKLENAALLGKLPRGDWEINWYMARSYLTELPNATKKGRKDLLDKAYYHMTKALSSCRDADKDDEDRQYVFSWPNETETDYGRLKEFLIKRYHIYWICTEKFHKSEDSIKISKENKDLSLTLNKDDEVVLKIDDREIDKFIAEEENSELKIYDKQNKKIKCLVCIGWICLLKKDYSNAISHLLVANASENSTDFKRCICFLLGLAYLKHKLYNQSKSVFKELLKELSHNYVLRWNNIPGEDDGILKYLLTNELCIELDNITKIEITNNGGTIEVSANKTISLSLSGDKVKIKVDNVESKGSDFKLYAKKEENNRYTIYSQPHKFDPSLGGKDGLKCISEICLDPEEFKIERNDLLSAYIELYMYFSDLERYVNIEDTLTRLEELNTLIESDKELVKSHLEHCWGWWYLNKCILEDKPVLRDVKFKGDFIKGIEIQPEFMVNLAIEHLQKSLGLRADHYAYLHLAQAYELQMTREKDEVKKAIIKKRAMDACQCCIDLDHYEEHDTEAQDLKKRLEGAQSASSPPQQAKKEEDKAKGEGGEKAGSTGSSVVKKTGG